MKKGQEVVGVVSVVDFPNRGRVTVEADGEEISVLVKNVIEGQKLRLRITKKRKGKYEGRVLEVLEPSLYETRKEICPYFGECGGCLYDTVPYEKQLAMKEQQIKRLLAPVIGEEHYDQIYEGIIGSPEELCYRNKMEYTFGDYEKGGELSLGHHKRGSFYDILPTVDCRLVDSDMRKVHRTTLEYFRKKGISYFHRRTHEGYLRHLLVRKAKTTGEILVSLVTAGSYMATGEKAKTENVGDMLRNCEQGSQTALKDSIEQDSQMVSEDGREQGSQGNQKDNQRQEFELLEGWKNALLSEEYEGTIAGILHTKNDRLADVVEDQGTEILYGKAFFYEELLGLRFLISPFSFFQTNSKAAELLYDKARSWILESVKNGDCLSDAENSGDKNGDVQKSEIENINAKNSDVEDVNVENSDAKHISRGLRTVYDLYSGTGTIAQMLSAAAGKVVGVEIVEEAVEAAKENAKINGITNCEFIANDVLKALDDMTKKPDFIVLDPPRDGVHPKALPKILSYGVDNILYISCKATSLARDLPVFKEAGYEVRRVAIVDMFPNTANVETVALLGKITDGPKDYVKIGIEVEDYYKIKDVQNKQRIK